MATAYENLPAGDDFDEDEIDFSDLREQYEVRLEEGLDAFIVLDGLPKVPEESVDKLKKFITKKLNPIGRVRDDGFYMPIGDSGQTEGCVDLCHSRLCCPANLI
jgi:translation initiation factor 3 subunit B